MSAPESDQREDGASSAAGVETWRRAQRRHINLQLTRLRLLLARHVAWLRSRWKHDPLQTYGLEVIGDAQADSYTEDAPAAARAEFQRSDAGARELGARIAAIEASIASDAASRAAPSALDDLCGRFRLAPFERDVLVLCVAMEVDPGFELLYAYVQDDAARRYPTPALAVALFAGGGDDEAAARAAFAPHAPLRDFGLIQLGAAPAGGLFSQPLRIDERLVHYLMGGANDPDPLLARSCRLSPDLPLAPLQVSLVERLVALAAGGQISAVNLVGSAGSGRQAIAAALARRLGLNLAAVDLGGVPVVEVERREWLRRIEREAILLNLGFYLEVDEADPHDRPQAAALRDTIDSLRAFIVVGSREPFASQRRLFTAAAPALASGDRRLLWRAAAPELQDEAIDALVQQFTLGPRGIVEAARAAAERARLDATEADTAHVWSACREATGHALLELGQRIVPRCGWDDLVLPDDSTAQLREIAAQVACRGRVYDQWGFGARLSRGRGIAALFAGPSGTGKTMAAEVLAGALALDLYRIDLSGVVSKYIGETEKNLRRVFDAAEAGGAILFFDEADALFGKRSEVRDSHDRYANIEVNYLLQRMEDYRGLAILATNMKAHLDPAFLRRLRFIVELPFPDVELRRRIWQRAFPADTPTEELDLQALARLEVSGGNIRNIALNAAFVAAAESSPVRMEHVLHAARREYQKLERVLSGDVALHAVRRRA